MSRADLTISVLMPVHNGRPFLDAAIESILTQTLGDFRFLILDDGSDDGTDELLADWAGRDPRIEVLARSRRGIVASLNELLDVTETALVARMDADDIAEPDRLELQVAELAENPAAVAVGSWVSVFGVGEDEIWHFRESARDTRVVSLLGNTCLCHPTLTARTDVLRRHRYRPEFESMEDMDLLCRIFADDRGAQMYALPQVLHRYRRHEQSISARRAERQAVLREQILEDYHRSVGVVWSVRDKDAVSAFLRNGPASAERVARVGEVVTRLQAKLPRLADELGAETRRRLTMWREHWRSVRCA